MRLKFEKMLADTRYTDAAAFAFGPIGAQDTWVALLPDALANKEGKK